MGMRMYLRGNKIALQSSPCSLSASLRSELMDGFPLVGHVLKFGIWRNSYELHDYIVSDGSRARAMEVGQSTVVLDAATLQEIISVMKSGELRYEDGDVVTWECGELKAFEKALDWSLKASGHTQHIVTYMCY